jgi:hypothetical protein
MPLNRSGNQVFWRAVIRLKADTPVLDLWEGEPSAWPATEELTAYHRRQKGRFEFWFFAASGRLWSVPARKVRVLTEPNPLRKELPPDVREALDKLQRRRQ